MNPALMNLMSKLSAPSTSGPFSDLHSDATLSSSGYVCDPEILCLCREPQGQASGGDDSGNDDWIFNTIREKDLKKLQNGAMQPTELESKQVGL